MGEVAEATLLIIDDDAATVLITGWISPSMIHG
jgi:hypothetical protein